MTDEIKSKLGQMLYLASDGYSCRDEFEELCKLVDTEITSQQSTIDKLVAALEAASNCLVCYPIADRDEVVSTTMRILDEAIAAARGGK